MAIDPKATQTEPETLSFGGVVPHISDQPAGSLSLEDAPEEPMKLDISGVNSSRPAPNDDAANKRTDKIDFALGKDSPGKAVIKQKLLDGQEEDLRDTVAKDRSIKDDDLRIQTIREKASQGDMNDLESLIRYRVQHSPDTVFEKAFAEKYVPVAEALKNGDNILAKGRKEDPDHLMTSEEIAQRMVQKQEIAKFAHEDEQTKYDNLSFGSKAWEIAKAFVPGRDWYKTYNSVKGTPTDSILQGSNWADQIHYLYTLPADEMQATLRQTLDTLRESDPRLAVEFSSAVVHYTGTDAFIHNVGNVFDVATTVPGVTKAAIAGAKAALNITSEGIVKGGIRAEITKAYKDHVAANSAGGDIKDTFSKMGDLDQAAILKATERAKELLLNKGQVALTRDEIRTLLPSVFNPEAILADGSNLSAKQTMELMTHLTYNSGKVLDRISNLVKIGRLPEEALQVAIKEAKDALKDRFKSVDDAVIDVVHDLPKVNPEKLDNLLKAKAAREGRELDLSRVPNYDNPDVILKPEEIPADDPMRDTLLKWEERKAQNKAEKDQLLEELRAEKDSRYQFEVTRPEDSQTNTGSVMILLGDKFGNSFNSRQQAYTWAKNFYGIHEDDIYVKQRGVGYYIGVKKDLDETSEGVRAALITTKNTTPSHLNMVTGLLKGNGRLSQFQNENRIATVHGQQALVDALKDMHKDLTSLSRKERAALSRVMQDNHVTIKDPETGETGVFHRTIKEFSDNFQKINGRIPSAKETKAYFTAVQVNDFEFMLRNNSLYRELSRLGLSTFYLKGKSPEGAFQTKKFYGKFVDNLPLATADSKHPARVAVYHEGEEAKIYDLNKLNEPDRMAVLEQMKKDGYKIIQTGVPNRKPGSEVLGEGRSVNFIITKDYQNHQLDFLQLPYKEGWHQEYAHKWYVKQPIVRRIEEEGRPTFHEYEGDKTAFAFHTEAEARKYAKVMDEARRLLKNGSPELDSFLERNLPYNRNQFEALFGSKDGEEPIFHIDDSFLHTSAGVSLIDSSEHNIASRYENFIDNLRSPWNLYDQVDKKFVGQRDELLHTISEKGSEANPVFQLQTAELIDPMASLSRAMTNMVRNQFMLDYRTQAVESWIAEFGKYFQNENKVPTQELYANALHYLYQHNPFKRKTLDPLEASRIDSGLLAQQAIKEFLGNSASDATGLDHLKNNLMSSVYANFGQDVSNKWAPRVYAAEVDPVRALRSFAFHTTIGMFNPIQLWQNAQTMANAVAIGGLKHGPQGFAAGHMFQFMRLNQNDAVVARLAKLSGWKEEDFREAWNSFVASGRFSVEGEHAWKDDLADPAFYTFRNSILGDAKKLAVSVLDKGTVFFKEGERMSRMVAYATAYHEWRAANPAAKLTAEASRGILKRSDDMTVNMTRASMASWQSGMFSVPAQFLSYNARIMEQMLGKTLTAQEKGRIMLVNSALYGVPIGLAMPLAGIYNPWEDVRGYFLKKGWNVNDKTFDTVMNGIEGLAASVITGRPNSISERSGPGGTNFFRDVLKGDKTLFDVVTGAAGTKAAEAVKASMPFVHFLASAAEGKPEDHPVFASDILTLLRTVKSIDQGAKLYMALTTNSLISKSGIKYDEINTPEAIIMAATGGEPRLVSDEQLMITLASDRKKAHQEIEKEITKLHQQELTAMANGDEETFKGLRNRIKSLWMAGGFRPDEQADSLKRISDQVNFAGKKIRYDWVFKNADPDEVKPRYDQWMSEGTNTNQ